ncbi:MAG: hypothetical protein EOM23_10240 [Candidatus Moranbacteria bacterium]|nr:hypothetical protein [Candidatus Moranbacteria bacterium]
MLKIYKARPEEEQHKEHFYIIGLDTQNIVKYIDLVGIGTISQCAVYVRECLRLAIIKDVSSVIISHNHPSGVLTPSREDKLITDKIKTACSFFDIKLLDHIICGDNEFYSFCDMGEL